jgi:MarR family 2-MHQ and catechol resistance regulon transcriptional repressor
MATGKPRKDTKDKALDKDAWELHEALSDLVRVYQFRDRKRICCHDVSVTQCYTINMLILHGAMTLNGLAGCMYLDKSTASRVVDSLVKKGYVRRAADPADARAVKLEVTREGKTLYSRIEKDLVTEMKKLIADFEPGARSAASQILRQLTQTAVARFSKTAMRCDRGEGGEA